MRKLTIFSLILFVMGKISISLIFAQEFESIPFENIDHKLSVKTVNKTTKIIKLSSSLNTLFSLWKTGKEFKQFANQSQFKLSENKVVLTIVPKAGTTTDYIDLQELTKFGVIIQAKARLSMRVEIPLSQLKNVAIKVRGIGQIRQPMKPQELAITSEGVALMNANNWHAAGYYGTGVKVAVIDGGFNQLTEAQGNGDIPAAYVNQDFTATGLETGSRHGTAVAEAVFDVAPLSQLYLYKIGDFTDFQNAKEACKSNGVHIINHSMGWFNTGGYYDGTGYVCDVASDAINSGIIWVNSAGNSAEDHYRATFSPDENDYHIFGSGNINPLGPEPGYAWLHSPGEVIIITLNWNNYPTTNQDYDLYLYRWTGTNWILAASSTETQNGSRSPEESIGYENSYTDGMYGVSVRKSSATTNVDFTLFSLGKSFSYRSNSSSIIDPATVTDVVTVGAINRYYYTSGPQENFSSQGPTTDGRIKPDVAAPDNCNSYAYGYWSGTSLSSPYTAGICALVKSRYPGYASNQVRNYLYNSCTIDLGSAGKDNIYGWGKIALPENLSALNVSGNITYYSNSLALQNDSLFLTGGATASTNTNSAGYYEFVNLTNGLDYTITPAKTGDISSFTILSYDASLAAQIAVNKISNPPINQRKAADVDQDGNVLMYDASLIAMYAVGLTPNAESQVGNWIFNPTNRTYTQLSSDQTNEDFAAIVLGDLDGNWSPANFLAKGGGIKKSYSNLSNQSGRTGEKIIIPIISALGEEIYSCDIILNYEPTVLKFEKIATTSIGQNLNIVFNEVVEGKLRICGFTSEPVTETGAYLEIVFEVIGKNGDRSDMELESYRINTETEKYGIATFVVGSDQTYVPKEFALYQNYPNPFNPETTIKYQLAKQCHVYLTIYDILGRSLRTLVEKQQDAGEYEIKWNGLDDNGSLLPSGLYFYEIQSENFQAMKKLLFLK